MYIISIYIILYIHICVYHLILEKKSERTVLHQTEMNKTNSKFRKMDRQIQS